ncbi:MAG: O-antigen ligase family protein, partial [Cyanobacteria bacterium P01_F01_bin.4]
EGRARGTAPTTVGIYVATVLSLGGIFCSGSRNGLLIAIGMLLVVGLLFVRRSRFLAMMGLGVAIALVTGTVLLGAGGRAFNLALMTEDPRLDVWQIALSLIQHRPWLGWGLGGFSALYVPMSVPPYERIFHAHNLWLYLASEVGLPLMVAFNIVIGRIVARGVKTAWLGNLPRWSKPAPKEPSQKSVLLTYLLAFGGCMAFGLFDVTLFDARINVLSWLLLAGIALLTQNSSELGKASER